MRSPCRMWKLTIAVSFILGFGPAQLPGAESGRSAAPQTLPLWPKGAPGAKGKLDRDVPAVTVYLPPAQKTDVAAIVVCPGGGYGGLAISYEGHDVARWLN